MLGNEVVAEETAADGDLVRWGLRNRNTGDWIWCSQRLRSWRDLLNTLLRGRDGVTD